MGRHWVDRFNPEKLRAIRKERGLSQQGLANKLTKFREAISYYETGAHKPRTSTLAALAVALEVEIDAFLDDDSDDIAALRARQGLKQADVATAIGMNPVTYQRVEVRRAKIDADRVPQLARILKTDAAVLANLIDVRPSR